MRADLNPDLEAKRTASQAPETRAPDHSPSPKRKRWLWVALALYGIALASSHFVRLRAPEALPADRAFLDLPASLTGTGSEDVAPTAGTRGTTRMAYRAWQAETPRPTILLLHGSPGSADDFQALGARLAERYDVIAPDLPGFGGSTRRVASYSIEAHAAYATALLDLLGIDAVHVVGFSMGGGVALHLADRLPERVRSLVLLSSIGVQELELLGNYHVNHALHGIQLAGITVLHQALPHFGKLDGFPLDIPYARNFYDTDQRPLTPILERLAQPTLIVHGEHDMLVPFAAAQESHRLVPQSELITFDANHFMVFRQPQALAAPIEAFVSRVVSGTAIARAASTPERQALAAAPRVLASFRAQGVTLLVILVLLALATMASEDLTCITAGLLVARGNIGFVPAAMACASGIFIGDMLLYGAGRLGHKSLSRAPLKYLVSAAALARSQRWFAKRGPAVIFASRFIPGLRLPTYVSAGLVRMPVRVYALWLLLPVAIWTPLVVEISRRLGDQFLAFFERFEQYAVLGFVGILVTIWLVIGVGQRLLTYGGRRQLLGWWRRQIHWEFWPIWRLYPPVVAYIAWLALRYRSATLFTLANPGLPAGGGLVGESKSTILGHLGKQWVPPFRVLPADATVGARIDMVDAFMREHDLRFPIILKPNVGERGTGVVKACTHEDIESFCRQTRGAAIVQAYVEGPELGVFYVRLPEEEKGRIFAITDKQLPEVVGDGRSTIERLILADPRAVAMASTYLAGLAARIDEVPAAGEIVRLVEIGTHRLGAVFLDGEAHRTAALEAEVERISQSLDGFYFGRFDLRAPSLEDFHAGRNLSVLELNGVSSEATNIYDPDNSLFAAYKILFAQWRLAFAIGDQNRKKGLAPLSIRQVIALLRARHG